MHDFGESVLTASPLLHILNPNPIRDCGSLTDHAGPISLFFVFGSDGERRRSEAGFVFIGSQPHASENQKEEPGQCEKPHCREFSSLRPPWLW